MIIKKNRLEWVPNVMLNNDVYNVNSSKNLVNDLGAIVLTNQYNSPVYDKEKENKLITDCLYVLMKAIKSHYLDYKPYLLIHSTVDDNNLNHHRGLWKTKKYQAFNSPDFLKGKSSCCVKSGYLHFYSYVGFENSKKTLTFCKNVQDYEKCFFLMLDSSLYKFYLDDLVDGQWEESINIIPNKILNFLSNNNSAILLHSIEGGDNTEWGAVAIGPSERLNRIYKQEAMAD